MSACHPLMVEGRHEGCQLICDLLFTAISTWSFAHDGWILPCGSNATNESGVAHCQQDNRTLLDAIVNWRDGLVLYGFGATLSLCSPLLAEDTTENPHPPTAWASLSLACLAEWSCLSSDLQREWKLVISRVGYEWNMEIISYWFENHNIYIYIYTYTYIHIYIYIYMHLDKF